MKLRSPLTVLALLVLTASAARAGGSEAYVDAILGDDEAGHGTPESPYRTITKAVITLVPVTGPTTVHVAPGVYGPSLGEGFPISLTRYMSILGAGADQTVITGEGSGALLVRMTRDTLISDLTLQRAAIGVQSPGICFALAEPIRCLRRCVIRDNSVGVHTVDCSHSDHGVALVGCVVTDNQVGVQSDSMGFDFQSVTVSLYGTTVTRNGIGLYAPFTSPGERYLGVFDSIVIGNTNDSLSGWTGYFPGVTGNLVGDPSFAGVDGNVLADPLLFEAGGRDFHLQPASPAVDLAGPPVPWPPSAQFVGSAGWVWDASFEEVVDLDGDPRDAGGVTDAGADSVLLPTMYAYGLPELGTTVELRGQGLPADLFFANVGFALYPAPLLGFVWLQPPAFNLGIFGLGADGVGSLPLFLPPDPTLTGLTIHLQAIRLSGTTLDGSTPETLRLLP